MRDTQTRQESQPPVVCHSYFGSIMMPTCKKPLQLWLKRAETHIFGKNQNSNDQTFHAMPRQRLTGVMLFLSHFEQVFLSLSKAKRRKKKQNTKPWLMQQSMVTHLTLLHSKIEVEHESSSQVQQLHNLLERKTRQAHSERVLLSELCFTCTLIHHHVCKT